MMACNGSQTMRPVAGGTSTQPSAEQGTPQGGMSSSDSLPETFRVVFIADTHIIGPQYTCCHESPGIDNASIMKTPDRLKTIRSTVNAMEPQPDLVFVLGDVVHAAHHNQDFDWYTENETAFSIAANIFSGFKMPVHYVFGNHDYEVTCDVGRESYPLKLSHQLFEHYFKSKPYHAVEHKGWRFLATNGQLGDTWTVGHDKCNTDLASYGREQLDWIAKELDKGQPTIVLSHYMRLVTASDEFPDGPHIDFFSLLDSRTNVGAVLVGHTHRWIDLTALNNDVPHHVLASTRYDTDNFWTVEFTVDESTFEILDFDKRIDVSSCASSWSYDGLPMSLPDVGESGDCVIGMER